MLQSYSGRTLREIVRVVASRFPGMVIIFVLVVGVTALATWIQPRQYRSEVSLLAKPSWMMNPLETKSVSLREEVSLFVVNQREIIMSETVIASALMKLLGETPDEPAEGPDTTATAWYTPERVATFIDENGEYFRKVKKRLSVLAPGGQDAQFTQNFKIQVDWPEESEAAAALGKDSRELAAIRARKFCDLIVQAYQLRYATLERKRAQDAATLLSTKSLAPAKIVLDKITDEKKKFVTENLKGDLLVVINMISSDGAGAITGIPTLATQLQTTINQTAERIAEVSALRTVIETELKKTDHTEVVVPDAVTAANPSITTLQDKIITLKLKVNELTPSFTSEYRELANVREELKAAEEDLYRELGKQKVRLDQELDVLNARKSVLVTLVSTDNRRLETLAGKASEYQRLQADEEVARRIYEEEQKRVVSAATATALASNPILVSIMDGPTRPSANFPRRPIVWLNLLIAALSGMVLAMVYAFMADHFDHTIKSIDDAERYLGIPVLASVPKLGRNIIETR